MGRRLLVVLFSLVLTACDDPLVIVGDLPGLMRVVVGAADTAGVRNDSLAWRLRLTRPTGVVVSNTGVLYFGDHSARIFSVTSSGRVTVLHSSIGCFEKTCLGRPQGIALTNDGNALLSADDMSDKLWRLTLTNRELVAIAGTGVNAVAQDGTPAAQATLSSPTDVKVLPDNRILIAERNANRIRVIGSDGILRTLAGNGTLGQSNNGGPATSSPLALPTAITVADNVLYIAETLSHTVSAVDIAAGTIRHIAGRGTAGFSGDGGPATVAGLNTPRALAITGSNLYIADQQNHRIRLVNLQSGIITTFAGTGATVFTGNGRSAGETSIAQPSGLTISSFGFLYIADWGHSVVWRTPVQAITQ